MKINKLALTGLFLYLFILSTDTLAAVKNSAVADEFIANMINRHQFNESALRKLFKSVEIKQKILQAIARPAESMPWYRYRKIFLTDSRIKGGVSFWKENEAAFKAVEQQYGVPAEIITAIIGVETRYGANTGSYRVIDALSTLAFAYPKRSQFFLGELENFLLLSREENSNPLDLVGSYAGAMGIPQFMPSSYRHYAVDFDHDGKRDIWNNKGDVIASVANYFARHHWQPDASVAFAVTAKGNSYQQALSSGVKPDITVADLRKMDIDIPQRLANDEKVKLLKFEQSTGDDLWIGLHNFYVITRYNHSPLYAMAVTQLSRAIARERDAHKRHTVSPKISQQ